MADIRKLNTADADFQEQLAALLAWDSVSDDAVNDIVREVIAAIRTRGDAALVEIEALEKRAAKSGMRFISVPIRHIGTERCVSLQPLLAQALDGGETHDHVGDPLPEQVAVAGHAEHGNRPAGEQQADTDQHAQCVGAAVRPLVGQQAAEQQARYTGSDYPAPALGGLALDA